MLTPQEADQLFRILRALRDAGQDGHPHHPQAARDHGGHRPRDGDARRARWWRRCAPPRPRREQLAELMVGRTVLLRVEKAPAQPGARCSRSSDSKCATGAACARVRASASRCARARSSASPASPATASRSCSRRSRAFARRSRGEIRSTGATSAERGDAARVRRLGLAHVPEDRQRMGLVERLLAPRQRDPRLPRRCRATTARCLLDRRRSRATAPRWRRTTCARADRDAAQSAVLRRQPAEARAGAGDRARSAAAAGRPADARRGHRRHRVHPRQLLALRDAGQGDAAGLGRAGRDPGARRPHPRDVRRAGSSASRREAERPRKSSA